LTGLQSESLPFLGQAMRFPRTSTKILRIVSLLISSSSSIIRRVIRRSVDINSRTVSTSVVRTAVGRLLRSSSDFHGWPGMLYIIQKSMYERESIFTISLFCELESFSSCFARLETKFNIRSVTTIFTIQHLKHDWAWATREKWLILHRKQDGRVSLNGQVETCFCVLLNARNGLSPCSYLSSLVYKMLRYVSAPHQLHRVHGNADGVASWRFYYESCLQEIYAKEITAENIYESTTRQWRLNQWARILNLHLEMVHSIPEYTARFAI
jgi:hypothetical protein